MSLEGLKPSRVEGKDRTSSGEVGPVTVAIGRNSTLRVEMVAEGLGFSGAHWGSKWGRGYFPWVWEDQHESGECETGGRRLFPGNV